MDHAEELDQDLLIISRDPRAARRPDPETDAFFFMLEGELSQLVYGTVRESQRRVIHVVRVQDKILGSLELEDIAERMRERLASRGELAAEVVMVQGASKETLHLSGNPYSVSRVRAALFNATVSWTPISLDR